MFKIMYVVAAVFAFLLFVYWRRRSHLADPDRAWMPSRLRGAQLVYRERLFRAPGEIKITAKLDRGYRVRRGGEIVLVELKTRRVDRPYRSDVIELSAQRYALQAETGELVAEFAYVLVQHPETGRKTTHRVRLLMSEAVIALAERREALLVGKIEPEATCMPNLCAKCPFLYECTAGDCNAPDRDKAFALFSGSDTRQAPQNQTSEHQ